MNEPGNGVSAGQDRREVAIGRNDVSTDGVIFAEVVEWRGYLYLEWRCPDCGRIGSVGFWQLEEGEESFRSFCQETGREFLAISGAVLPAECDGASYDV